MAKKRPPDYPELVYTFIRNHAQPSGEFPPTYEIAERCKLRYETVYHSLKLLEKRGLIEVSKGKRVCGVVQVERRLKKSQ